MSLKQGLDASDGWTEQLHNFFIELFKPIALNYYKVSFPKSDGM